VERLDGFCMDRDQRLQSDNTPTGLLRQVGDLGSDPVCAFGSFALVITDPTTTWSDDDFDTTLRKLETLLGCPLQRIDAHY
jgi:hypothetical protein